ncbi:MAG: SDR family NAD(P)-dependent oxidoreductase, partial [Thermoleophilaceae bacterium]
AERFGGIDILINNASAIQLAPMRDIEVKRFDLMLQINTRGTFVATKACLPHLRSSDHAHLLTLSPPIDRVERWLAGGSPFTSLSALLVGDIPPPARWCRDQGAGVVR